MGYFQSTIHRKFSGHSSAVAAAALSPDAQYVVSGSYDTDVRVWDVSTASCLSVIAMGMKVNCVGFISSAVIAVAAADGCLRLFDFNAILRSPNTVPTPLSKFTAHQYQRLFSVCCVTDSRQAHVACVCVWQGRMDETMGCKCPDGASAGG